MKKTKDKNKQAKQALYKALDFSHPPFEIQTRARGGDSCLCSEPAAREPDQKETAVMSDGTHTPVPG